MRLLILVALIVFRGSFCLASEPDRLFTEILKSHVNEGLVDYQNLRQDKRLAEYIKVIAATNPDELTQSKDRLAFWINVYNAYTLKIVCDNYPLKSIRDLGQGVWPARKSVWDMSLVVVNNKAMTLNDIEHKIIRPEFKDPRIHFALVCAARGCPPLRMEAYRGSDLAGQLEDQTAVFLTDRRKNYFNLDKKIASISPIMRWYVKDFGGTEQGVLEYIARFLPAGTRQSIEEDASAWRVRYTHYDWSLNKQGN